jgi:hypothetical protein
VNRTDIIAITLDFVTWRVSSSRRMYTNIQSA